MGVGQAPYLPGTISVATIWFAGQPSCAALRASDPTVKASWDPSYSNKANMAHNWTRHPIVCPHCLRPTSNTFVPQKAGNGHPSTLACQVTWAMSALFTDSPSESVRANRTVRKDLQQGMLTTLSDYLIHLLHMPPHPLDMIAELFCIINFSYGFEENPVFGVKHKQGWVRCSWATHGCLYLVLVPNSLYIYIKDPKYHGVRQMPGMWMLHLHGLERGIVLL